MQNYRYEYLSIAKQIDILKYIQCNLFDVVQFDNCKSGYSVVWRLGQTGQSYFILVQKNLLKW
jgi:hypothetical protein